MTNPIIQEVREAREALAAQFDFDLHRIMADAMARQAGQSLVNRLTASPTPLGRMANREVPAPNETLIQSRRVP